MQLFKSVPWNKNSKLMASLFYALQFSHNHASKADSNDTTTLWLHCINVKWLSYFSKPIWFWFWSTPKLFLLSVFRLSKRSTPIFSQDEPLTCHWVKRNISIAMQLLKVNLDGRRNKRPPSFASLLLQFRFTHIPGLWPCHCSKDWAIPWIH